MEELLTIGRAAKRVGLNSKTIRYYEEIGLLPPFRRTRAGFGGNGYRLFNQQDLNRLEFIKRARHLGLSLARVKELLVATERGAAGPEWLSFVDAKIAQIEQRIQELQSLRRELEDLRRRAKEAKTAGEPCCEPVCGPITCGPSSRNPVLVEIRKGEALERR